MIRSSRKPVKAYRPCLTRPSSTLRTSEPAGTGVALEREEDLYAQWERSAGRTVRGLGGRYRIVYQGRRNGGPGPDYLGAALVFPDGILRRGDVEIHLRGGGWDWHGHRWDPRYRQVILHVIATGPLKAVRQEQWRVVPTVPLPREPASSRPLCEVVPQALIDSKTPEDFLHTLATQRWWRRLAEWKGRDTAAVLDALAHRLGTDRHRLNLVRLWETLLPGAKELPFFVSDIADRLDVGDGGRFRRGLPGRLACLSALAFTHHRAPRRLWSWSLAEVQQLVRDLQEAGFPVPTRSFLVEVAGNWLLPFSSVKTDANRFEEWYQLPLGWTYGRVRRHVERLGLRRPASFGQQQGLLEWIETLCQPVECACCPVVGAAGEF